MSKNPRSKLILVRSEEITVATGIAGEHVKGFVCFAPAPLSAQFGVLSLREILLLKGVVLTQASTWVI